MNDNDLFTNIISVLRQCIDQYGMQELIIMQNYQRKAVETPAQSALLLTKLGTERINHGSKYYTFDAKASAETLTENYIKSATFQVDVFRQPALSGGLTASDMANIAADALQSQLSIDLFKEYGMQIYFISNVRDRYFVDEQMRNEQYPSFDFKVSYTVTYKSSENYTKTVYTGIHGI